MKRNQKQHGFIAVVAIFLVVILAALGAFMLTFSNAQQLTSAQDVRGSRAYWAARAGQEWGVARILVGAACPAASTTKNINGFTVVTNCTSQPFNEGGVTRTIYLLKSIASAGGAVGSVDYIDRSLTASLEL